MSQVSQEAAPVISARDLSIIHECVDKAARLVAEARICLLAAAHLAQVPDSIYRAVIELDAIRQEISACGSLKQ